MVLKLFCLLAIVTFGSCHVRSGRVPRQAVPPLGAWGVPPTNKTIPYRLDALTMSSKEKEALLAAIKYWSENTCIDFREARAEDEFVATFIKTGSCHSPVGRSSSAVNAVNAGCGFIRDVHEIQHLLGISHTHVRSDRDKFIKIDQERMKRLNITQYVMKPNYDLFGVPYDYGSILHYGAGPRDDPYFVPTLSVYDRTPGLLLFPSFYDVLLANMINLCNEDIVETCHESAVKCENGGYIHPRDCSKCVCPLGFTGRTCSEILIIGSCGGILNASDQWQNVTIQMNPKDMTFDIFNRSYCSWHIKAPPGKKIEINLTEIETNVDCNHYQVCYAGFEFKIALDPRLTGPKFCCSSHLPRMVSQLNTVPIIGAIDDFYPMNSTTSFTYRFVDGSTNSTLPDDYGIPLEASESVTTTSTTSTTSTTTTESPSTTTTTESTSTTTTTESPSTTTTTESPSTTTTIESPSTTTTTSEAPTTRQLPKTTTTDSTIVQSTTNAMSTSELSTLPTTDTSTELPITTDDPAAYSTTGDESTSAPPTITHLSPTTSEQSTESTNEAPIDCTTTYATSTTDATTESDPTTVDDSTISTRTDFPTTSTTTTTESPTTTTTTEAPTTISARNSTIITTELPTSTSPSNEKCAPNIPCSEGYLCNFRAGICERYAKNCSELKCNADEYCEMQSTRCDATECDLRPLCLNRDPRAPMTCRNHLCSKDSMCLMCPLCGNIPTCVDPTPVIVSRPFVYCGTNEPCAQGSHCNYKTGRCEPRVYPTPGNG